jgi:hypothetical protein
MYGQLRRHATYANVMATIAVFLALGGTSYAFILPRDSVGSRELRRASVGRSELKRGAVTSPDIADRSVALHDISRSARASLRGARGPVGPPGPQGPSGVTFFAAVNAAGRVVVGHNVASSPRDVYGRMIQFPKPVDGCAYSATLARVPGGIIEDPHPGSSITVAAQEGGVLVRTWNDAMQPESLPFHLIVAC